MKLLLLGLLLLGSCAKQNSLKTENAKPGKTLIASYDNSLNLIRISGSESLETDQGLIKDYLYAYYWSKEKNTYYLAKTEITNGIQFSSINSNLMYDITFNSNVLCDYNFIYVGNISETERVYINTNNFQQTLMTLTPVSSNQYITENGSICVDTVNVFPAYIMITTGPETLFNTVFLTNSQQTVFTINFGDTLFVKSTNETFLQWISETNHL